MSAPEQKIERFMEGLTNPEAFQMIADVKPGDPQFAALIQYISSKQLSQKDLLVDFGAGGGVLAHVLNRALRDHAPRYIAVDMNEPLDALSLPVAIHNNSQKISVSDQFNGWLRENGPNVSIVVIRNVLHELPIKETAELFFNLLNSISRKTEIYIQDMVTLPRAERNRAGWQPDLLKLFLEQSGFATTMYEQQSYSGTNWFAMMATVRESKVTFAELLAKCQGARRTQQSRTISKLKDKAIDTAEFVRLTNDSGALTVQLADIEPLPERPEYPLENVGVRTVPKQQFGPGDFAIETENRLRQTSGIVAVISRKNIIDFDSQLARCQKRLLLSGLSLRKFFGNQVSLELCERLVFRSHGSVKLVMSDPTSPLALLRSLEPAYGGNAQTFLDELNGAIADAKIFYETLVEKFGKPPDDKIDFRISSRIMYSSCVIVDNLALVSGYSSYTTGSTGLCFAFDSRQVATNDTFRVIEADFDHLWSTATSIIR
jgi:hypothetical protein